MWWAGGCCGAYVDGSGLLVLGVAGIGADETVVMAVPGQWRLAHAQRDAVHPLDVPHPRVAGHNHPQREPVVARDRGAVHLVRQQHVAACVQYCGRMGEKKKPT